MFMWGLRWIKSKAARGQHPILPLPLDDAFSNMGYRTNDFRSNTSELIGFC